LRIFDFDSFELVFEWEAHSDYIRYIQVHPSLPYILSCGDDHTIKLWDWEAEYSSKETFAGHSHYVMMIKLNPADLNTFASASLDCSVKLWELSSGSQLCSLEGHAKGVNCIDFYPASSSSTLPYLVSGADDYTIIVWNYQTRAQVHTLQGHEGNVSDVSVHPRLPLIISGSEDHTVRVWHNSSFTPLFVYNAGLERVWTLSTSATSDTLAIGCDLGSAVVTISEAEDDIEIETIDV